VGGKGKKNARYLVLSAWGQEGLQPSTIVLLQRAFPQFIVVSKDERGGS
jgi:hypothetical protein